MFIAFHFKCAFWKKNLRQIREGKGLFKDELTERKYFRKTGIYDLPANFEYTYDFRKKRLF